ncbi:MAG: NAD(P)H-hydrate dehydratase [Nocardioidaceae bacterium]
MTEPVDVDLSVLRGWPLPEPGSDKTARGVVLMVGGSAGVPGAMVLAGEASLRAGAGKLQVVTTGSVAGQMAVSIPEALVRRAEEAESGDISPSAADEIVELAQSASAVLLGPGIMTPDDAVDLLGAVVPRLRDQAVVIDALASAYLTEDITSLHHLEGPTVLTLNPTEVSHTLGVDEDEVSDDPVSASVELAAKAGAVALCGGSQKIVASPSGEVWRITTGNPGLGVSGSGDVQAGIVTGLLARGAEPEQAAVWGAWLHGRCGDVLAESVGPVGYLARELAAAVPRLMADAAGRA